MAPPNRRRDTDRHHVGSVADDCRTMFGGVRGDETSAVGAPRPTRRLAASLLIATILTAACSGADDAVRNDDPTPTETPATITTTEAPAATETSTSPEVDVSDGAISPGRAQLNWLVDALNNIGRLTVDGIEDRFSPLILEAVPADQLIERAAALVDDAEPPLTVEQFEVSDIAGLSAEALLVGSDGRRLVVTILVDANAPNLIVSLDAFGIEQEFPTPINVDAIDERLADLALQSSLGVYDVTDGLCTAVEEIRADAPIVLGSVFKLWILAALANEIGEGRASWDEPMTVTDELRSSPMVGAYELETGTEVTLEQLAHAMILLSDNTATDMLLDRIGREAVEAAMVRAGVTSAAANVPILSTGNLFALKYVADAPNAVDYRALDEAGKRALLDGLDGATLPWVGSETALLDVVSSRNADGLAFAVPRDLDIEWFATAADLCRTLVHLDDLAETSGLEPAAAILEVGQGGGLPFDRDRWPTVRFKGGSEGGVIAGAWWFEGADGDRYVVTGGVADPENSFDSLEALLVLGSAIELIG